MDYYEKFEISHIYFKIFDEFPRAITVLPFNEIAAEYSARFKASLSNNGTPIGAYDILIAGIAMESDFNISNIKRKRI